MIKFGNWLPDLPDNENPGALLAKNVIPRADSYGPLTSLSSYTNALTARCQGATAVRDLSNNVNWFAGDATKLYRMTSGTTWSDVSGAAYNTGADEQWRFTQYGNRVIAANYADNLQSFIMGTSSVFSQLVTIKARYIATVKEFVVIGNTNDGSDGDQSQRVRWCAIDNPTDWTVSATTQADYQDLREGGEVMGIVSGVSGSDAIILQRDGVQQMNYIGSPAVFSFNRVEGSVGCISGGSVARIGSRVFYLGEDGFYMTDGVSSVPIGNSKVNKWFLADLNQSYTSRISSMTDPINQLVIWSYQDALNNTAYNTRFIIYNWVSDRWSYGEVNAEFILPAYTLGQTIDDFGSTSIDDIPFSLDSGVYQGGRVRLAAFDTTHKMGFLTGTALEATIDTGEAQLVPSQRALLKQIWPLVDGGTLSAAVGYRDRQNDSVTWATATSQNSKGFCPARVDARYHRVRLTIAAGGTWTHAQGIDLPKDSITPTGW